MAQLTEMVPPAAAGALLRAVFALPRPVKRLIAGAPVRRDGQELALDAQLLLLMSKLDHRSLAGGTPEEARAGIARAKEMLGRVPDRPVRTREVAIADAVTGRLYTPKGLAEGSPLLVYYHGGGWVIGDIDSHDTVCRYLAAHADVRVLSVGYRLAPEHPYPAAAEDALTAYEYAVENAADLGAGEAVAVGGDSAGGNLAAVVGIMADPAPDFALLIYPAVDLSTRRRSRDLFAEGFYLTDDDMTWFSDHYCPPERRGEPMASPLLAGDLSGFPPTYLVTAGFDPLRDEGEEFAKRLEEAGVPVALRRQEDLIHAFANMWSLGGRFQEAMSEAAGALRTGLYAGPRRRS